jgi:ferric-dicitrate binding protein FerR (iron transport regulator)
MKMDQELLFRYLQGVATDEEKIAVVDWLDESPENFKELQIVRRLHDMHIWQESELQSDTKNRPSQRKFFLFKRISIELVKIAAVFVVVLLTLQVFFKQNHSNPDFKPQTVFVPAGQRAIITLSDGTEVWLNANTRFTFPDRFTEENRKVSLNGEGYFKVTKDPKRPFLVHTDQYIVKVWGTSFNLMAYSGSKLFETSLLEGTVEVLNPGADKGIIMKPNQRIYLENNELVLSKIQHYNHFLWKEGLISFDNESFPEMVKKLELYFDLKIEVKNEMINRYHCTGKFRTKDGIEHILKVLQLSNRFNFRIDEKQNVITIN